MKSPANRQGFFVSLRIVSYQELIISRAILFLCNLQEA